MVESIILTHAAVLEINPRPSWHTFWLQDWWSIATLLNFHHNFTKSQHISWSQGQKITDASPNPPAKKNNSNNQNKQTIWKTPPFPFPFPGQSSFLFAGFSALDKAQEVMMPIQDEPQSPKCQFLFPGGTYHQPLDKTSIYKYLSNQIGSFVFLVKTRFRCKDTKIVESTS